jgi:hypothetical protein
LANSGRAGEALQLLSDNIVYDGNALKGRNTLAETNAHVCFPFSPGFYTSQVQTKSNCLKQNLMPHGQSTAHLATPHIGNNTWTFGWLAKPTRR